MRLRQDAHAFEHGRADRGADQRLGLSEVLARILGNDRESSEGRDAWTSFGAAMEGGEPIRDGANLARRDLALRQMLLERGFGGQAFHLDSPFDDGAVAADLQAMG